MSLFPTIDALTVTFRNLFRKPITEPLPWKAERQRTERYRSTFALVHDEHGEWFEVYNPTSSGVHLHEWTIETSGGESYTINHLGLQVLPGGYLSFGRLAEAESSASPSTTPTGQRSPYPTPRRPARR